MENPKQSTALAVALVVAFTYFKYGGSIPSLASAKGLIGGDEPNEDVDNLIEPDISDGSDIHSTRRHRMINDDGTDDEHVDNKHTEPTKKITIIPSKNTSGIYKAYVNHRDKLIDDVANALGVNVSVAKSKLASAIREYDAKVSREVIDLLKTSDLGSVDGYDWQHVASELEKDESNGDDEDEMRATHLTKIKYNIRQYREQKVFRYLFPTLNIIWSSIYRIPYKENTLVVPFNEDEVDYYVNIIKEIKPSTRNLVMRGGFYIANVKLNGTEDTVDNLISKLV